MAFAMIDQNDPPGNKKYINLWSKFGGVIDCHALIETPDVRV